jgi:hypothetical protein
MAIGTWHNAILTLNSVVIVVTCCNATPQRKRRSEENVLQKVTRRVTVTAGHRECFSKTGGSWIMAHGPWRPGAALLRGILAPNKTFIFL